MNEVAGKTASKVVAWVVPQIMQAWDDDRGDVDRTLNRIVYGVLHHPAQRDLGEDGARDGRQLMFKSVEEWWGQMDRREQDEYRRKLSRDGVERGENHKEGVQDTGHGCGKPIGMHKNFGGSGSGGGSVEDQIAGAAAGAILGGVTGGLADAIQSQTGVNVPRYENNQSFGGDSKEGGIGGLISGFLGGGFDKNETQSSESVRRDDDGGYTESHTEYGHHGGRYAQAEATETRYGDGTQRTEYNRFEQQESRRRDDEPSGYGYQERHEVRPTQGGGYEERTERRYESNNDSYQESSGWNRGGDEDRRGDYSNRREERTWEGGREERQESRYESRQETSYGGGREDYGGRRDDGRRDERRDEEESGGGGFLGGLVDSVRRGVEDNFDDDRRRDGEGNGERRNGWGF